MSHYSVMVAGPDPEGQLAPFDEGLEVDPYKATCFCVGLEAKRHARNIVEVEYKSMQQLRKEFSRQKDRSEQAWKKFIAKYLELEERFAKAHRMHNKPDLGCSECGGSGWVMMTNNKQGMWAYYLLGGRWRGFFKLKEGAKGVLGRGQSTRFDADQALKKDIDFDGMRKALKERAEKAWQEFKALNPEVSAKKEKKGFIKRNSCITTHAVLIDGKWYEQGRVYWMGMGMDSKDDDKWTKEFWGLMKGLPDDTLLSVYDCHV
jgi:hypothetical protein